MPNDLAIIQGAGVLAADDMTALVAMSDELARTWRTVQRFRTRTEMHVSVLNDIKHPTPDSKYWQAVREQNVMLSELVNLSYEYRKVMLEQRRLRRSLSTEVDDIEREALGLEIERQDWLAVQMQKVAGDRVREVKEWSAIKAELEPHLQFGTDDVDAHQVEAMIQRFQREAAMVNEYTPVADARNIIGLAETSLRVGAEL